METSQLLNRFKTSIFTEMAHYKEERLRKGQEVFDLSIGSPDAAPPNFVLEALSAHVLDINEYRYPIKATEAFLEAVRDFYKRRYLVSLDEGTEIIQLSGSQEGLVHLPLVCANPGDIILIPDPGYPAYQAGAHLAKATVYPMPLKEEHGFLPNLAHIPKSIAEKAKMMFLNFPGNPVPTLPSKAFFEEVVYFAKKYDILVAHDFAYSELNFSDKKPLSFLSIPGAKDVGIEFNSLSKSFNLAGCRIGYAVGNASIIQALNRLKSNLDFGVFLPIQYAATLALNEGDEFLRENAHRYKERRDLFVAGLNKLGWNVDKPLATMFLWARVPKAMTSYEFTLNLMDKTGVVVTPGSAFGKHGEGYVRIGLVEDRKNLQKVLIHIERANLF